MSKSHTMVTALCMLFLSPMRQDSDWGLGQNSQWSEQGFCLNSQLLMNWVGIISLYFWYSDKACLWYSQCQKVSR